MIMGSDTKVGKISRRDALAGAGAGALGLAAMAAAPAGAQAAQAAEYPELPVMKDGVYPTKSLRQESIRVSAIQTVTQSVDVKNLKATMKENLGHVLRMIDLGQNMPEEWGSTRRWGAKQDLLCFHEFPL